MKKLVAILLLSAGFASQIEVSDNNYPDCPPCNIATPSPRNTPATTPKGSDDKK